MPGAARQVPRHVASSTRVRIFPSWRLSGDPSVCRHDWRGAWQGMDVIYERCAGIDIGKADVKVCVRSPGLRGRGRHSEVRTFTTMTRDLLALRDWLATESVTV